MRRFGAAVLAAILGCGACEAAAAKQNFGGREKALPLPIEAPLSKPRAGEDLFFDVLWMGIHIGTGQLLVDAELADVRGRRAYHITATARTNEFLSNLYPVVDVVETYIDAETLCSLEFRKTLSEGSYHAAEKVEYDYAAKKARYESTLNGGRKEFDIGGCERDLLASFYWYRLQPLTVSQSVKMKVHDEDKLWDLEVKAVKTEVKELRRGELTPAILTEPITQLKGVLYRRGKAWVSFSCDAARVPISVVFKTPFGPVRSSLRPPTEPQAPPPDGAH